MPSLCRGQVIVALGLGLVLGSIAGIAAAADLSSASFVHRAGSVGAVSAVGERMPLSSSSQPAYQGSSVNVGTAPTAGPSGSSVTLVSVLPGFLPIAIGEFATLDLDGDGEQFFLDLDDDGDGLADVAETATGFFVSPTNTGSSPVDADSDGDGFGDGFEVASGTDPNDPLSSPAAPQVPALESAMRLVTLLLSLALATLMLGSRLDSFRRRRSC